MTAASAHRPALAAMQTAFLEALLRWAIREAHGAQLIALPSGRVDGNELRQAIIALVCARDAEASS
jgi:hypothetical protein